MPTVQNVFRGNPRHLALLTEALEAEDIPRWNSFVRRNGASFRIRLAGANLSGLHLNEIRLEGADLRDANLSNALLIRADLSRCRLRGANLTGANLTGAKLNHADLSHADLSHANLSRIQARNTSFAHADLSETILDGTDLSNASVKETTITGASRAGAKIKVRVKVKTTHNEATPEDSSRPWIKALDDEKRRRENRTIREKENIVSEKRRLDGKFGRRKPLFNRVK